MSFNGRVRAKEERERERMQLKQQKLPMKEREREKDSAKQSLLERIAPKEERGAKEIKRVASSKRIKKMAEQQHKNRALSGTK